MQVFICKPARATNPKIPFRFVFSCKTITIWMYEKIIVIDVHSNKNKPSF